VFKREKAANALAACPTANRNSSGTKVVLKVVIFILIASLAGNNA
jgi:hypothetical protein